MKVSLLIYEDAVLSAVASVIDIFNRTSAYLASQGQSTPFELELVSENQKDLQLNSPARLLCFRTIDEATETDLVIVPAFANVAYDAQSVLQKNYKLVEWIKKMHARGSEIASLCFGAYFLAEAGLLNGSQATSHWMAIDDLKRQYPKVQFVSDKVITDCDGIYTGGGAFSSVNLILYLIEKFGGRDLAIWVSKMFSIDMDRSSQSHFSVFSGQHRHEDLEIRKSQVYIEANFSHEISVDRIASETCMSKRSFIRRFKSATNNTPLEYLQRVRVESAKKLLESNDQSITTLPYDVGYNDLKTFRMIFKRFTGLTPLDYRRKYARQSAVI